MAITLTRSPEFLRRKAAEERQRTIRARREELHREYGGTQGILRAPIDGSPVENPRVHGEALEQSIKRLAGQGCTDGSIAKQLGINNLDRVRLLREYLGVGSRKFDDETDDGPEAA